MSFLYFDCYSGLSGNMIIASLLDIGASFEYMQRELSGLNISAQINRSFKSIQGIQCSSFEVASEQAPLRYLSDIQKIIADSSLPLNVKGRSIQVFTLLAEAEGRVHGIGLNEVHFHEIGAVDTIVDIVGTFLCLESLGINEIYSSPLPWSSGFVDMDHGRYPLPAPATTQLLSGFPCVFCDAGIELVTPTGAALITSIATPWTGSQAFIPVLIGHGAGNYIRKDKVPNLLRVVKAEFVWADHSSDSVNILETEVDDVNPEFFTHLHHIFMSYPGVLDYFTTPIHMKKNRPGTLITLITRPESAHEIAQKLLLESGSLGVRYRIQHRFTVPRTECQILTRWGPVRIKIARYNADSIRIKPEFDDVQAIAVRHNLPLFKVYEEISGLASSQKI